MHTLFFKKYFFINNFDANLIKCQDNNTSIIYRNYRKKNYLDDIFKLKKICKKYKYKLILANDVKLAIKLGLDGAYLPSFNNTFDHLSYSLKKDFVLLGSAHNLKEIKISELVTFILMQRQLFEPLSKLAAMQATISQSQGALERIYDILTLTPEIKNPEKPKKPDKRTGKISFISVSFSYDQNLALNNVSFNIEKKGLIPNTQWKKNALGKGWLLGETIITGIGQGYIQTTPIQLCLMTAQIANGGFEIKPRVLVNDNKNNLREYIKYKNENPNEPLPIDMLISNFDLKVNPGELTVLVGPSGCGKTTLVNLIAGFDFPESGEIQINGEPITGPGHDRMVVFQETALMPWLTSYENVVFGPKLRGDMSEQDLRRKATDLLTKVGLSDFMDKYPLQLSGGMQRRAELARAMINEPLLMIMDEPFRGLDAMSRELMQEFFVRLFEDSGRTNVFVTSEIEEAIFLADRLVVLSNRPTSVRKIIDIKLPRPRNFQQLTSSEAFDYKREAMELLHEEALKGFKGASSESQKAFMESITKGPS